MITEILVAALVFFLIFIAFVGYKMVKPPRIVGNWTPKDLGFEYKDIEIITEDNVKLDGWWIENDSDKTVIPLHGYISSRWAEHYMKPTIEFLLEEGYNVLVFDFRGHGKSGGKYTTVGDKEILDLKAAVKWLRNNYPEKSKRIGVIGFSMGALVAIRGLSEVEEICCGVADSPPIYFDKTGARGMKYFVKLPAWLYLFVKPFSEIFSGGRTMNVLDYANKIRKPLLLIIGRKDLLVEVGEVQEFYERNKKINPNVELWVTDAPHVRTIQVSPEAWKSRVRQFLKRWMG